MPDPGAKKSPWALVKETAESLQDSGLVGALPTWSTKSSTIMVHMDRLWDRTIKQPNECLEWQGALDPNGYGAIKVNGKKVGTHRLAYELTYGPIPDGLLICHSCDNRKCLNPEHLWLGTYADNNADMTDKGRRVNPQLTKTHCPQGHEYSKENTRVQTLANGSQGRKCKECHRVVNRNHMRMKRQVL